MLTRVKPSPSRENIGKAGLRWLTPAAAADFDFSGYVIKSFHDLRRRFIEPARLGAPRATIENPASGMLAVFEAAKQVAITDVPLRMDGDLRDVYGFIIEPAWRRGVDLVIVSDSDPSELDDEDFDEADMGYAWTLERLRYVLQRYGRAVSLDGLPPLTPIEADLLAAMRNRGLAPRVQYGVLEYRVDFAFPDIQLAIEADGKGWHDARRDRRRDERLQRAGWRVLRFTGSDIYRQADQCAAVIEAALAELKKTTRYSSTEEEAGSAGRLGPWARFFQWLRKLLRQGDVLASQSDSVAADSEADARPDDAWLSHLDPGQQAAATAGAGVVQLIAPAGSGKTTTVVARVQELLSRGVAANRILCTTFNKEAALELRRRLSEAGAEGVETRSFHGIGWMILNNAKRLRGSVGQATFGEWRFLVNQAKGQVAGEWIDPADAQDLISKYKLASMVSAEEARSASELKPEVTPRERTEIALYQLYEQWLKDRDRLDFDDLIAKSVELLRAEPEQRRHWQDRYECVLVDEYQDIEPAQELLVKLLAAPQDSIFAVGDEDQCIYAWRRASVKRVIQLDQTHPGLERYALTVNYRCPRKIVQLSHTLIEHNANRFPKQIEAAKGSQAGKVSLVRAASLDAQASHAARLVDGRTRGEVVILGRSTRVLREAALACARRGISVDAPERVLNDSGVNGTILSYLRLFANLGNARVDDVRRAFRIPNRYLNEGNAELVATRLRRSGSFKEALEGIDGGESWRVAKLEQAAELFDRLALVESAAGFLELLRSKGGLDRHYSEQQRLNATDQSAVDALVATTERAAGMTVAEFTDAFDHETRLLERHLDQEMGIELRTIHGAKGLEWAHVILLAFDEGEMPHHATMLEACDAGEALEDERRLAYVAFTRSKGELTILCDHQRPSPFLAEAMVESVVDGDVTHLGPVEVAAGNGVRAVLSGPGANSDDPGNGSVRVLSDADVRARLAELRATHDQVAYEGIREKHPRAYERWTDREDELLVHFNRAGMTPEGIASRLGRQPSAIRSRLEQHEWVPTTPSPST